MLLENAENAGVMYSTTADGTRGISRISCHRQVRRFDIGRPLGLLMILTTAVIPLTYCANRFAAAIAAFTPAFSRIAFTFARASFERFRRAAMYRPCCW